MYIILYYRLLINRLVLFCFFFFATQTIVHERQRDILSASGLWHVQQATSAHAQLVSRQGNTQHINRNEIFIRVFNYYAAQLLTVYDHVYEFVIIRRVSNEQKEMKERNKLYNFFFFNYMLIVLSFNTALRNFSILSALSLYKHSGLERSERLSKYVFNGIFF